jgi:outer membrane protein assembly factor BamD (BamD/ComL family)
MNYYSLILFFVVLISCKKEVPEALKNITKLEQEYEKAKDPNAMQALLAEYIRFITSAENDKALKLQILEKAEKLSTANNRFFESVTFLNTLIKEDPESSKVPDRILQLADIMRNVIRNENASGTLYKGFLEKYPQHPKAEEVRNIIGIAGSSISLKKMVENLAGTMYDDSLHQFNETAATQYVDATEAYVLINPTDLDSPELLNKAAETARQLKTYSKAIALYDWIIDKYPTHKLAPQSFFMKAFTFDNDLKDIENAKLYYEEFSKRYPNHDFADDAKVLMENLGKSDQEFLESIQKKD